VSVTEALDQLFVDGDCLLAAIELAERERFERESLRAPHAKAKVVVLADSPKCLVVLRNGLLEPP